MDPEKRVLFHRIKFPVEIQIVLIFYFRRSLCPKRGYIIYYMVFICLNIFTVFPLCLLPKCNWDGHELAIFGKQLLNLFLLCKIFGIVIKIKSYGCTSLCSAAFLHSILGRAVATPLDTLCPFSPWQWVNLHFFRDHECRIEPKSKVSYYAVQLVFIFLQKFTCAGECNLVNILINFLWSHSDTAVGNSQYVGFVIIGNFYCQISKFSFIISLAGNGLHLLRSIYCIGYQLSKKNFMIRIQEFFNDREYVLCGYSNFTFCHNILIFNCFR